MATMATTPDTVDHDRKVLICEMIPDE